MPKKPKEAPRTKRCEGKCRSIDWPYYLYKNGKTNNALFRKENARGSLKRIVGTGSFISDDAPMCDDCLLKAYDVKATTVSSCCSCCSSDEDVYSKEDMIRILKQLYETEQ